MAFQLDSNVYSKQKSLSDYMAVNDARNLQRAQVEQSMTANQAQIDAGKAKAIKETVGQGLILADLKDPMAVPKLKESWRASGVPQDLIDRIPDQITDDQKPLIAAAFGFKMPQPTLFEQMSAALNPEMAMQRPMSEMVAPPTQDAAPIQPGSITTNELMPPDQYEAGLYGGGNTPQDAAAMEGFAKGAPVGQGDIKDTQLPAQIPDQPIAAPATTLATTVPAPRTVGGLMAAEKANAQLPASIAEAQAKGDIKAEAKYKEPLPTAIAKVQDELVNNITIGNSIGADLGTLRGLIDSGDLDFGVIQNALNEGKNFVNSSDPKSRNYQTFMNTLEKLRNDSLRLNKGVQTEGDSVRAWNEVIARITDTAFVKKRLKEIEGINERGVGFQKARINQMRKEYGKDPLDFKDYEAKSIIQTEPVLRPGDVYKGHIWNGGDKSDPASWKAQ